MPTKPQRVHVYKLLISPISGQEGLLIQGHELLQFEKLFVYKMKVVKRQS